MKLIILLCSLLLLTACSAVGAPDADLSSTIQESTVSSESVPFVLPENPAPFAPADGTLPYWEYVSQERLLEAAVLPVETAEPIPGYRYVKGADAAPEDWLEPEYAAEPKDGVYLYHMQSGQSEQILAAEDVIAVSVLPDRLYIRTVNAIWRCGLLGEDAFCMAKSRDEIVSWRADWEEILFYETASGTLYRLYTPTSYQAGISHTLALEGYDPEFGYHPISNMTFLYRDRTNADAPVLRFASEPGTMAVYPAPPEGIDDLQAWAAEHYQPANVVACSFAETEPFLAEDTYFSEERPLTGRPEHLWDYANLCRFDWYIADFTDADGIEHTEEERYLFRKEYVDGEWKYHTFYPHATKGYTLRDDGLMLLVTEDGRLVSLSLVTGEETELYAGDTPIDQWHFQYEYCAFFLSGDCIYRVYLPTGRVDCIYENTGDYPICAFAPRSNHTVQITLGEQKVLGEVTKLDVKEEFVYSALTGETTPHTQN